MVLMLLLLASDVGYKLHHREPDQPMQIHQQVVDNQPEAK
jgi:hypothetical protein